MSKEKPLDWQRYYLEQAVAEAETGLKKGDGGPFGALIIKDDKVIARAHNRVLATNDPTAHAEITAIRKATRRLGRHNLEGCILVSTSEPCPMCLAAIFWSRIKEVYYGCGRAEAARAGFDDELLYRIFRGETAPGLILRENNSADCASLFRLWQKTGGVIY